MQEIVLPETKPALEWINGRVLQKVSPRRRHSLAQMRFAGALDAWAEANRSGMVGTEWEFRVAPPGEARRPLVPDVAYVSYVRLPYEDEASADIPRIAPDAVVEVLSPNDRRRDVDEKIRVYLACGSMVVFVVDTHGQTVTVQDGGESHAFTRDEVVRHASLPGFVMPARALFERPRPISRSN
jgi:Uma2 family endonuclease